MSSLDPSGVDRAQARIEAIIGGLPQQPVKGLTPDSPLLESGVLDSLSMMELVSALEADFGVSLDENDLTPENFHNIRSITALIVGKLA